MHNQIIKKPKPQNWMPRQKSKIRKSRTQPETAELSDNATIRTLHHPKHAKQKPETAEFDAKANIKQIKNTCNKQK